jgi:hypothetical protein
VVVVAVSTAVVAVVSMGEVSAVAVSAAAVLAVVVSVEDVSPVAVSMAVDFVAAVSVVAISTAAAFVATVLVMTDSPMMSSSAASAFPGGGVGAIRTDITVTTITRMIPMDTVDIHMDTAGTHTAPTVAGATVTTAALVMDIAMGVERVIDMAMAAEPVTDTTLAAEQGILGVRGVGDSSGYGSLKSPVC